MHQVYYSTGESKFLSTGQPPYLFMNLPVSYPDFRSQTCILPAGIAPASLTTSIGFCHRAFVLFSTTKICPRALPRLVPFSHKFKKMDFVTQIYVLDLGISGQFLLIQSLTVRTF